MLKAINFSLPQYTTTDNNLYQAYSRQNHKSKHAEACVCMLSISSRFLNVKFDPQEDDQPRNCKCGEESKSLLETLH